jgi:hypothetical protein
LRPERLLPAFLNTHHAPPVAYPVGRSRLQVVLLGVIWLMTATVMLAWQFMNPDAGWRRMMVLGLVAAAGVACWIGLQRQIEGDLIWDGTGWHWKAAGRRDGQPIGHLQVVADLQRFLILQVPTEAGPHMWLWLDRRSSPSDWLDLRRAVHGRLRPDHDAHLAGGSPAGVGDEVVVAVSGQGKLPLGGTLPLARP